MTRDDLTEEIKKYEVQFRQSGLDQLKLSPAFDLKSNPDDPVDKWAWPAKWPHAECPGVYAFFAADHSLLYIGKASMKNTLGKRLSSYFKYGPNRECCPTDASWKTTPRYLAVIKVPQDRPFEAAALEEYLISKLDPPENSVGR